MFGKACTRRKNNRKQRQCSKDRKDNNDVRRAKVPKALNMDSTYSEVPNKPRRREL